MIKFYDYQSKGGAVFTAEAEGDFIVATRTTPAGIETKKRVRVEPLCSDKPKVVYHLMKTKIQARGGARGLIEFLGRCESFRDFGASWDSVIFHHIFNMRREA